MISVPNRIQIQTCITRFLKSDLGIALGITAIWKIALLAIGYTLDVHLHTEGVSFLHHTFGWDAGWYAAIIQDHYQTNVASAAFYPLFPLLVSLVHTASFGIVDILTAGQIVTTLSVWFLIAALLNIGEHLLGKSMRFWLVGLILAAPTAFFLHLFYSEALFMALGLWAYAFALRRQWIGMSILLALLTAVRLPALLFVGLCGLEFMRAYGWKMKKIINKNLLLFLLTPLGFIMYGTYLSATRGDFFGMFHAYQASADWAYQVLDINIIKTILRVGYEIVRVMIGERPFDMDILINHLVPVISILVLGLCSLYLLLRQRGRFIPLGIFGLASIIMFSLNSNLVSVHRYVLPCLTIYVAVALIARGKYQNITLLSLCLGSIAVQILLLSLFIGGVFAG